MKARLQLLAALAVALAPFKAFAQAAWIPNPDVSEGVGIRVGNLELHPSVGAEVGYDSNFFLASKDEGIVDVYKFRVTPSITLGTLSKDRLGGVSPNVRFAGGAYASYYELVAADSKYSAIAGRRNVAAGADAKLHLFPEGRFGVDALAAYVRRTEDGEGRSDDLTGEGYNRDTLRGGAGVTWRPGGGLFAWRVGYEATYNWFEAARFGRFDNLQQQLGTNGRWRFLPRTALLWDSTYTLIRYQQATQQTDGDIVRTRIGMHGLVTYHLALMGMVGWGATFYQPHDGSIQARQYDSVLANAEARWFLQARPSLDSTSVTSGLSSIALGYARTVSNSYLGSFYQRDRGYLSFDMFLLGAIASGLEFGVSRVGYPDVVFGGVDRPAFSQVRIDARAFFEYRFTDTLAANATLKYDQVNSPEFGNEQLKYSRWQAYLGVRWFM